MDWFLRNINVVLTGEALFSALKEVDSTEFQEALKKTKKAINYLLNIVSGRLGLDHDRVLGGRYALPIMTRYVVEGGGKLASARERDKLLYWYVQTFLWGRFAGSTESVLNQDLGVMEEHDGALDRLIDQLRIWRGDLVVRPENFAGWSHGARFYPMLYLLTRVGEARDWGTGLPLRADLLGKLSRLQLHHIFPKAQLYKAEYGRAEVNALANFCFLTQATNLDISDARPEIYFAEIEARQALLAEAANSFLDSLPAGEAVTAGDGDVESADSDLVVVPGGVNGEDEEVLLLNTNIWITEQGLPEGEMIYELMDPDGDEVQAYLDLAWPDGLQQGLSDPVALLIDEDAETMELASQAGYRCFTNAEEFREYLRQDILALESVD